MGFGLIFHYFYSNYTELIQPKNITSMFATRVVISAFYSRLKTNKLCFFSRLTMTCMMLVMPVLVTLIVTQLLIIRYLLCTVILTLTNTTTTT